MRGAGEESITLGWALLGDRRLILGTIRHSETDSTSNKKHISMGTIRMILPRCWMNYPMRLHRLVMENGTSRLTGNVKNSH